MRRSKLREHFVMFLCLTSVVCSLAGPAHTVNGGEAHQQSSWQRQEPPEGEAVWFCLGYTPGSPRFLAPLCSSTREFLLFSVQHKTGLPISTYFSAVKLRWLLDNVDEVRQAVLSGRALFGTVDSWIIWVRAAPRNRTRLTDSLRLGCSTRSSLFGFL